MVVSDINKTPTPLGDVTFVKSRCLSSDLYSFKLILTALSIEYFPCFTIS